jgi:hypothetical protein
MDDSSQNQHPRCGRRLETDTRGARIDTACHWPGPTVPFLQLSHEFPPLPQSPITCSARSSDQTPRSPPPLSPEIQSAPPESSSSPVPVSPYLPSPGVLIAALPAVPSLYTPGDCSATFVGDSFSTIEELRATLANQLRDLTVSVNALTRSESSLPTENPVTSPYDNPPTGRRWTRPARIDCISKREERREPDPRLTFSQGQNRRQVYIGFHSHQSSFAKRTVPLSATKVHPASPSKPDRQRVPAVPSEAELAALRPPPVSLQIDGYAATCMLGGGVQYARARVCVGMQCS